MAGEIIAGVGSIKLEADPEAECLGPFDVSSGLWLPRPLHGLIDEDCGKRLCPESQPKPQTLGKVGIEVANCCIEVHPAKDLLDPDALRVPGITGYQGSKVDRRAFFRRW